MNKMFSLFFAFLFVILPVQSAKSEPPAVAAALVKSRDKSSLSANNYHGLNKAQIFEKQLLEKKKHRANSRNNKKISRTNGSVSPAGTVSKAASRQSGSADKGIPSLANGMFVK